MATFISILLATLVVLLAIPVVVLLVEILAAVALPKQDRLKSLESPAKDERRRRVAVLVPAHNESVHLLPTLADITKQLRAGDRLLVVADNCSDDTTAVATAAGAEVAVRNDADRPGKGYALDWGIRHLAKDPPDIVIMIDADCRLAVSAIDRLQACCSTTNRPVQALYLTLASEESPIDSRVAEFAWRVKNYVRPSGLHALGFPCQLLGSGMAFPWEVIRSADLASGMIVEDLKLGLDVARAGNPPVFCPSAGVTSYFPFTVAGTKSQRLRQERGYLAASLTMTPRLIFEAAMQVNMGLLALALDLTIPPLAFLGVLLIGMMVLTGAATLLGIASTAFLVSLISLVTFINAIFISWLKCGRDILPAGSIWLLVSYVLEKLSLYHKFLSRGAGSQWIRTDRAKS